MQKAIPRCLPMLDGTPPFLFSVEPALPEGNKKNTPPPKKKNRQKESLFGCIRRHAFEEACCIGTKFD